MPPARVSRGALAIGAAGSTTPAFGQATTAGNFLILYVVAASSNNAPTIAGWTLKSNQGNFGSVSAIYIKPNCGASETAPTVSYGTAGVWACLEEWSGLGTSDPTDHQVGSQSGSTVAMSSADTTSTDVLAVAISWLGTKSATLTVSNPTVTPSGGTSALSSSDGGTKATVHAQMYSQIMSSNSAADTVVPTATPSQGTLTPTTNMVSFAPPVITDPWSAPIVVSQAVSRAANF